RFKMEDVSGGVREESLVLDILRRSRLLWLGHRIVAQPVKNLLDSWDLRTAARNDASTTLKRGKVPLRLILWLPLGALALWGIYLLLMLVGQIAAQQWLVLGEATGLTLLRVFAAVALGTIWMVPIGVFIGLRPRLAGILQPVIQVAASFPAPM